MVKITICCPACNKDIVIEEKVEIFDLTVEKAKKMWAEWEKKPDSEKAEELEKFKKELALNMKATNNKVGKFNKELKNILENHKISPYEKKVNLFNLVKDLNVGESQPLKEQRMNYLLESRLYDMLAKKALEDYKKTTVKFSKTK